jgi:hypothetical protein
MTNIIRSHLRLIGGEREPNECTPGDVIGRVRSVTAKVWRAWQLQPCWLQRLKHPREVDFRIRRRRFERLSEYPLACRWEMIPLVGLTCSKIR